MLALIVLVCEIMFDRAFKGLDGDFAGAPARCRGEIACGRIRLWDFGDFGGGGLEGAAPPLFC